MQPQAWWKPAQFRLHQAVTGSAHCIIVSVLGCTRLCKPLNIEFCLYQAVTGSAHCIIVLGCTKLCKPGPLNIELENTLESADYKTEQWSHSLGSMKWKPFCPSVHRKRLRQWSSGKTVFWSKTLWNFHPDIITDAAGDIRKYKTTFPAENGTKCKLHK